MKDFKPLCPTFLFISVFLFASPYAVAVVNISTATGDNIHFNNLTGKAEIEGNALVVTSTATLRADKISMDMKSKEGEAVGNVVIDQASGTITGSRAIYNWETSTGTVLDAEGNSDEWHFRAQEMVQEGPGLYRLYKGGITTCDLDPPHYWVSSKKIYWIARKKATLTQPKFKLDDTPIFWLPRYSRSLKPKKYSLRIEPGSSGRDGLIVRSSFGYPFSENTYTRFKWDYFQYTGNGFGLEHQYNRPDLKGAFDSYYINDTNPDLLGGEHRQYRINWNHYQKITSKLTANGKVNLINDQNFVNQYGLPSANQRSINPQSGLLTEIGLTYQFKKAALVTEVNRQDRYDLVTGKSYISNVTLPRITYTTVPLSFKKVPFYTSFTANFANDTNISSAATQTLRYQHSASAGVNINKDVRVSKKVTLTPRLGYSETWQDRDFANPDAESDRYLGRYTAGLDLRDRLTRMMDLTLSYLYGVRFRPNELNQDIDANDYGIESNRLNGSLLRRIGRNNQIILASGYDFRQAPRSDPDQFAHGISRVSPPSIDIQWELRRNVTAYYREVYGLYDPVARRPVRTPINTSGEVQFGNPAGMTFFSQGFSHTKTASGQDAVSNIYNKLKFYLSPHWYLDFSLAYQVVGPQGLDFRQLKGNERKLTVIRDLHCWIFRMEFLANNSRKEASFYIDLKTNVNKSKNVFNNAENRTFYTDYSDPTRTTDISNVFPSQK